MSGSHCTFNGYEFPVLFTRKKNLTTYVHKSVNTLSQLILQSVYLEIKFHSNVQMDLRPFWLVHFRAFVASVNIDRVIELRLVDSRDPTRNSVDEVFGNLRAVRS